MKYAYRIDDHADTFDIGYKLLDSNNSEVYADRRFYLLNDIKAMACYTFNSPNSTVTHIKNESTPVNAEIFPKGISTNTFMASSSTDFAKYMCPLAYKFRSSSSVNDAGYYPMYDDSDYMQNMYNIVVTFDKIILP